MDKILSFVFSSSVPQNPLINTVYFVNNATVKQIMVYKDDVENPLIITDPAMIASIVGNAGTATKLQTARTINGTNFDGTANITTDNWGTSRTLTVGNTGKNVNGSENVSWSLAEIGVSSATKVEALNSTADRSITPTTFAAMQSWQALTGTGTVTLDMAASRNFNVTVTATTTFAAPTGIQSGACGEIYLSLSGNFVVSWNTAWKFIDAVPTISASGEKWVISYKVVDATTIIASAGKLA